jgi:tetratricopeptide (TPR) repeat protein
MVDAEVTLAARIGLAILLASVGLTSIGAAADPRALRLFQAGDYAGAARVARSAPATLDMLMLAAEANERAEGPFADTDAALGAAASLVSPDPTGRATGARIAAIRALLLVREGKADMAAKTLLEGRRLLGASSTDPDASFDLQLVYGRILLAKGLAAQAIGEVASVATHRLALPNGDPRLLEALYWLGVAQHHAGRSAEAIGTLREVVRVRNLSLGGDHPETLQARAMLAEAIDDADPKAAAAERTAILERWRDRRVTADARVAAAMLDLAGTRQAVSAADRSKYLRDAFALATTAKPAVERITAEAGLALAKDLRARSRLGDALDVLTTTISLIPQSGRTSLVSDVQNTRAVLYLELQRPAEAERIYRQLIAVYELDPTLKTGELLTLKNNLAGLLASNGQISDAIRLEREVVAGRTTLGGPTAPLTLAALSSLASMLSKSGRDGLTEALKLHRQVLAARLAMSPMDDGAVASSLHNAGATLDALGDYTAARDLTARAIALRSRVLGRDNPETVSSLRQLAGILFSLKDVTGAIAVYARVIASLERSRLTATLGDTQRRAFFSQYAQTYKMLAILEAAAGSPSAVAYADAARTRTLDEIAGSAALVGSVVPPDQIKALRDARAELADVTAEDPAGLDDAARMRHASRLDAATARLGKVEAEIEAAHPGLRFSSAFQPLDRRQIRGALGEGAALIEYVVLGDRVQILWIEPDDTVHASDLRTVPHLSETIKAYLALLSAAALSGTPSDPMQDRAVFDWGDGSFRLMRIDEAIPDEAAVVNDVGCVRDALSTALLGGLPPSVRAAPRWIVSPDAALATIPFDTLTLDGNRLIETKTISYTPSIRMLLTLHGRLAEYRTLKRDELLVVGAPNFAQAPAGSPLRAWAELAGSKAEVAGLGSQFRLKPGSSLFAGSAATESQVRSLDHSGRLASFRTIVFSTHGVVDVAVPERNAIVLMGDDAGPHSDGFMRAAELMSLHAKADLMVVSACESGVGRWLDGEGSMGLPFALFAAGSASTVLSHWSVADNSSAAFMARFFEKVGSGLSRAEALRRTKLDFIAGRAGDRWREPAFWAAFSFVGADG